MRQFAGLHLLQGVSINSSSKLITEKPEVFSPRTVKQQMTVVALVVQAGIEYANALPPPSQHVLQEGSSGPERPQGAGPGQMDTAGPCSSGAPLQQTPCSSTVPGGALQAVVMHPLFNPFPAMQTPMAQVGNSYFQ